MKRILITGATGNIGMEVIRYLFELKTTNKIIAGVRNIPKAQQLFARFPGLEYVNFDFENPGTFTNSLNNIDVVFLLRPPHISDIEKFFRPLIAKLKENGVGEIVFLSVQGAEKSTVIPHNKIEKLIREFNINHVFLRPSYFMQNLTTTLLNDIQSKRKIILPAGKAVFNWIDVENIGETCAILLERFSAFENRAIELTGYENENFYTVAALISESVAENIVFENVGPLRFFSLKKREGMIPGMIMVMIMLHFLPRFQKPPVISMFYEELTGRKPTTLRQFIERRKRFLISKEFDLRG